MLLHDFGVPIQITSTSRDCQEKATRKTQDKQVVPDHAAVLQWRRFGAVHHRFGFLLWRFVSWVSGQAEQRSHSLRLHIQDGVCVSDLLQVPEGGDKRRPAAGQRRLERKPQLIQIFRSKAQLEVLPALHSLHRSYVHVSKEKKNTSWMTQLE